MSSPGGSVPMSARRLMASGPAAAGPGRPAQEPQGGRATLRLDSRYICGQNPATDVARKGGASMSRNIRISDAEWEVMEAIWGRGGATAADVIEAVAGRRDWNHSTIRTMLARLVAKGALRHEG